MPATEMLRDPASPIRYITVSVPPTLRKAYGRLELGDVPPGDYLVEVLTDLDPIDWQLPESLDPVAPFAVKIRITEGAKIVQDLVARGR